VPGFFMLATAHRYFLEVMEAGSIKDAAARLHVAASAVSRQIAKLEDASGTPLFERRPHGMVPTPAGELLARYARRTALDALRLQDELRSLHRPQRTVIRVGSNEAFARSILPGVLTRFQESHPEVVFDIQIVSAAGVAGRLADGQIDIGVAYSLSAVGDVDVHFELPSPVCAIMAPEHPLAHRAAVTFRDLRPYPMALTESGTTVRLLFDLYSSADSRPFDIVYSCTSSTIISAIVRISQAVTFAGALTLQEQLDRHELVAVAIAEAAFDARTLQIQTARNRRLPDTANEFVDALRQALRARRGR
jgi:DNA-binding transcriptional LysR family regulator